MYREKVFGQGHCRAKAEKDKKAIKKERAAPSRRIPFLTKYKPV